MIKGIYIKQSNIQGKGVFASRKFRKGEVIFTIPGKVVRLSITTPKQSYRFINWIGLGKDVWLNPNRTQARHLNHSCEPNAAIFGKRTLVAIKDIYQDEEITFDYSFTDADPLWHVKCTCGARSCRGTIGSIQTLSPRFVRKHLEYIPQYFRHVYAESARRGLVYK